MRHIHQTLLATLLLLATTSATPTPTADTPPSAPSCGYAGDPYYTPIPLAAANELNGILDSFQDNPTFDNCFTKDDGSPNQIAITADKQAWVWLQTDNETKTKKAVGCARAANYLEGLIGGCNGVGGGPGVAGCQDVVEVTGLTICVGLNEPSS